MKQIFKLILLSIWFASATITASAGGHDVGSGGDGDEVLLRSILVEISAFLSEPGNLKKFPEINRQALKDFVNEIKVQVVETELRDFEGRIRTAINQSDQNRILVNRSLFSPIRNDAKVIVQLIFHELLGLMKLEASGSYPISSQVAGDALEIYTRVTANVSDIYFLTGPALATPIPLWKASVKDYGHGFISGVVARPFTLVTDRVKMVIDQGQTISVESKKFSDEDHANETLLEALYVARNFHPDLSYYRENVGSPWLKIPIQQIGLHRGDLSLTVMEAESKWAATGFTFTSNELTGTFYRLAFDKNGEWTAAWCQKDCRMRVGNQWLEITQIVKKPPGYKVFFKDEQTLAVFRKKTPLRFPRVLLLMNSAFEVTWGSIADAYVMVNGQRVSVGHLKVKEDGQIEVRQSAAFPDPQYAGVRILATDQAAVNFCREKGIPDPSPYKEVDTVYFTGEETFYDLENVEFVTLRTKVAKVFRHIQCDADVKVDINEVKQDVKASPRWQALKVSCESVVQ